MILPRLELPPLPRSGPALAGRAEPEGLAFDDAMREQEEPLSPAPAEVACDELSVSDSTVAAPPIPLDVLIAQVLPQQPAATSSGGDRAPSPTAEPPRGAAVSEASRESAPGARPDGSPVLAAGKFKPAVAAGKPTPVVADAPFDADAPPERVLAFAHESEAPTTDANFVAQPKLPPEPMPEVVANSRQDEAHVVVAAAPLAASSFIVPARDTTEAPARARRMEPSRMQPPIMRDALQRAPIVMDPVATSDEAPETVSPLPVRQQPAPEQIPQASISAASAQQAPAIDPARGRHAQAETIASPDIRRVVIKHVETSNHFAVVADPVRQIASEVVRAFEAPVAASFVEPQSRPVKTINVQLEPESLGAVTLRMRLSGSNLHVRVEVAEPATLDLIQRERDRLQKSMTSENVSIDRLEIRAASELTPLQGADGANAPKQDMNAPGQQARQNSASQGGEGRRENRSDSRQGESRKHGQDHDSPRGPVSRGVYL
jgi:flagellar hook-length control protein FliK